MALKNINTHRRLDEQLLNWATIKPAHAALVSSDVRISFAELQRRSEDLGKELIALGIHANDVVAFQLPNLIDSVVLYHAIVSIDAIVVPILPAMREHDLTYMLQESCAKLFVTLDSWRGFDHKSLAQRSCCSRTTVAILIPQGNEWRPRSALNKIGSGTLPARPLGHPNSFKNQSSTEKLDDISSMIFTSGTSGRPKGVLYSHRSLAAEGKEMASVERTCGDDILFVPPSIAHVSGICFALYMPMVAGATVCMLPEWNSDEAVRMIERERCTWTAGATPFLQGIVEAASRNPEGLNGLKVFRCGGASVPPTLVRKARALGIDAYRCYGMSEHPTISGRAGQTEAQCVYSDGVIHPSVEIAVVDPADSSRFLAPGEAGEIAVKGPDQSPGYLRDVDNFSCRSDGWFLTGDIGRVSADRIVTITGRIKDIIIRKGENIAAKELEDLIVEHPAVREAVVVGVPDKERGEMVCCVVVTRDSHMPTLADICNHLRNAGVAVFKLPERLECVDTIPHNSTGKVLKSAVKHMLLAIQPTKSNTEHGL